MDLHLLRITAIALGGAIGAVFRYAVVLAAVRAFGNWFPFGVLTANLVGCFLLGLLMHGALVEQRWLHASAHAGLTLGLLGALTTFSTFGFDTLKLIEANRPIAAALNVAINCIGGVALCRVGQLVGDTIWPPVR